MVKKNDEKISHHLVEIDCTTMHSIKRNEPLKNPLYGFAIRRFWWVRLVFLGFPKWFSGVASMGLPTGSVAVPFMSG